MRTNIAIERLRRKRSGTLCRYAFGESILTKKKGFWTTSNSAVQAGAPMAVKGKGASSKQVRCLTFFFD